jgi:ADP-ribose pyrophosphatase YjhB (NUDIX family)
LSDRINKAIQNLQSVMDEEGIDPTKGLPKELFHFATTLIPCANIDLFITRGKQLLLTWRDDAFYGKGWHIPGGCLRMKETLDNRIQETARNEIGSEVIYNPDSFITREAILTKHRPWLKNQLERSHNISMLFDCRLPDGFEISNTSLNEHTTGYLKWFDRKPEDLLDAHKSLYGDIIDLFFEGELKWKT